MAHARTGGREGADPGLQPERTQLAWRRTTLSYTVAAVLAARQVLHQGGTAAGVAALALSALGWVGFLAVAHRRVLALSTPRPRPIRLRGTVTTAACTVALAAFGATALF